MGAIGFAEACRFIHDIGFQSIVAHENRITEAVLDVLSRHPVKIFSPTEHPVISFVYEGVHAHDVATILADHQVMVRAGHHCCMPLMSKLGVHALVRIAIGLYNHDHDVERLDTALKKVKSIMQL